MKTTSNLRLSLANRVDPKYRPVFDSQPNCDCAALALYFSAAQIEKGSFGCQPAAGGQVVLSVCRSGQVPLGPSVQHQRVCGLRASLRILLCRRVWQSGCPLQEYLPVGFLLKDLDSLEMYDVPAAPVHLSNSTDALQPLELEHRDCLFVLQQLAERRHRFTTVTLLTKNPAVLVDERYVNVLHRLNVLFGDHPRSAWFKKHGHSPLRIEISLAFYNDQHRQLLDPAARALQVVWRQFSSCGKRACPSTYALIRCSHGIRCPMAAKWRSLLCPMFNPCPT